MLLAGPEPTEALGVFVESRAPLLFAALFSVFDDASKGSYAHACHVLDCLIECVRKLFLFALHSFATRSRSFAQRVCVVLPQHLPPLPLPLPHPLPRKVRRGHVLGRA